MRLSLLSVAFGIGAFLCGIRALGYWAILQLGGLHPSQKGKIALIVAVSTILFLTLSVVSAYLRERTHGARAVAVKALYQTGVYGLPPVGLFAVVSKGEVLHMPEVAAIFILFACLVAVFRPAHTRRTGLVPL